MEEFKNNLSFTGLMIPLFTPNISLQKSYFRRYVTPKMTIEGNIFLWLLNKLNFNFPVMMLL